MRTGTLTDRPRNHAEPAVRPTTIRPMQRIGRGIVHPTSLTQTFEHREIPPAIASPIFANPLVEFIHLAKLRPPTRCCRHVGLLPRPVSASSWSSPFRREPHEPQAICLSLRWYHFRWFGACRSAAAESAKPCRIHLFDGDPPIVMKCGRSFYPSRGRTIRLAVYSSFAQGLSTLRMSSKPAHTYPCGPKWSTRSDGKAQ